MSADSRDDRPSQPENLLWSLPELVRHVRHEDPEVRGWAAARLLHQFPDRCVDALAPLVLDDASGVADRAATHLARYGSARHHPLLERGLKNGREATPGACLDALAVLKHAKIEPLAAATVTRSDLNEEEAAGVLVPLMEHGQPDLARQIALSQIESRPALMAQPPACRALFAHLPPPDFPTLVKAMLAALAWSGADRAVGAFQAVGDALELEDIGWLLHTDRQRRIDLQRTLKVYDATYDVEVRRALGEEWAERLAVAFRDGSLPAVATTIAVLCAERAPGVGRQADDLPRRIQALAAALADPDVLDDLDRLGPPAAEPAVLTLLACALKLASYRALGRELHAGRGSLPRLLELAAVESGILLDRLPAAVEDAVRRGAPRAAVVAFAGEMLARRGPWYGRMMALELLSRVQGSEEVHEVIRCLDDESHQIVEVAGHSLEHMGPDVVPAVQAAQDIGPVDAVALEWMVAAVCQAGTREALAFILAGLDELVAELGAGFVCEWAAVLGAEELIPRFRALLDDDMARVGHALLLVSAIHNRAVPEEESILQAIDHADHPESGHGGMEGGAGEGGGGSYLM